MVKERPIIITNDLDGVHFHAPIPIGTAARLLRKTWKLPEETRVIQDYQHPVGVFAEALARFETWSHQYRRLKSEAFYSLEAFRKSGKDHQRDVSFAVLSGRVKHVHLITRSILEKAGYDKYFSEWLLNEGKSPAGWKEYQVRKLVEKGFNVVHLEDDLKAALCVARVNDQCVQVYLFKNLSNHPRLLQRAGVQLPNNVQYVKNFREANDDFEKQLSETHL